MYVGDGVLQFNEFVAGCRKIDFRGNLRKIFEEISTDGEVLKMQDLDPKAKGPTQYRRDVYGRDARIWSALEKAGVSLRAVQG